MPTQTVKSLKDENQTGTEMPTHIDKSIDNENQTRTNLTTPIVKSDCDAYTHTKSTTPLVPLEVKDSMLSQNEDYKNFELDRRLLPAKNDGLLPPELFAEAEIDLHEKQQWIHHDAQALREMLQKEKGLRPRTDESFLLTFLRARKFDYEKAFTMVIGYYRLRQQNQFLYDGLSAASLQHVWRQQLQTVLPHPDCKGRTVLLFRAGAWDPGACSLDDVFRSQVLLLEHVARSPITQLKGIVAVVDCAGLGLSHAYALTLAHIRRMIAVVQEVFPLRFKALHFVHEPVIFEWMFSLVKPFLSETLKGRLHFHGSGMGLFEHVPERHLPAEFCGAAPPLDNTMLVAQLTRCDDYFLDNFSYGYTLPPTDSSSESKVNAEPEDTSQVPTTDDDDSFFDVGSFLGSHYNRCVQNDTD